MNYLCIIKVKEFLFKSNTIYRKMVHINPNMPNFNVNQWHIVVQEHKDITHFEGVGPTESVQRIVTRIVHVDRLSELLIRAVNNRTRERNYFKKLVEFFQDEITEEEFDKEIEENENEYVITTNEIPTREDLVLACEVSNHIRDVKGVDDLSALFSFNQESMIKELEAK